MGQTDHPVYRFGPFRYDSGQRLLFRDEAVVPLAPKVAETLRVLLGHHGRVVAKAELMAEVWPDTTVEEIGLARNISQLRKALGDESESGKYIETLPKRGYRFVGSVVQDGPENDIESRSRATPQSIWRMGRFLLAAGLLCVILGFVYWQFYRPSRYLSSGEHIASIAVIPFECRSPELDCGAFPRGLTELLAARLSKIEGVHVLSPSTVYSYQPSWPASWVWTWCSTARFNTSEIVSESHRGWWTCIARNWSGQTATSILFSSWEMPRARRRARSLPRSAPIWPFKAASYRLIRDSVRF